MFLTEYDEEKVMKQERQEGKAEGIEEGVEIGAIRTLIALVRKGIISVKEASEEVGITETAFAEKMIAAE